MRVWLPMLVLMVSALSSRAAPKLSLDRAVWDFGEVDTGTVVSNVFLLSNSGDAELRILDLDASCGCTTEEYLSMPEVQIVTEADGQLKVEWEWPERYHGDFQFIVESTTDLGSTGFGSEVSGTPGADGRMMHRRMPTGACPPAHAHRRMPTGASTDACFYRLRLALP